ncbi:hypothetical protein JR316_0009290 [Psilocybe cubensis]|uniref:Uncharacterized protein n=1 Tax=Psilocybe cubensis TaxID=181762 RepID=A0ACB8GTH3_PSICU|nr:hypothetical protein JR316_0009290 [Psilocybe cubensis]KAH9478828.1 hypothetical protein JR316_0009290 [Psilocybe cubensis]
MSQEQKTPDEEAYRPVHLLSDKSTRLKRDIFLWEASGCMKGGLNHRITPVSVHTLNRWAKMIDEKARKFGLVPLKVLKTPG